MVWNIKHICIIVITRENHRFWIQAVVVRKQCISRILGKNWLAQARPQWLFCNWVVGENSCRLGQAVRQHVVILKWLLIVRIDSWNLECFAAISFKLEWRFSVTIFFTFCYVNFNWRRCWPNLAKHIFYHNSATIPSTCF